MRTGLKIGLLILLPLLVAGGDCPTDTTHSIDQRTMLDDGTANQDWNQSVVSGLCACLDFAPDLEITDSTITLTVELIDREPVRGFELNIHHNLGDRLSFGGSGALVKGSKLEAMVSAEGDPVAVSVLGFRREDYIKILIFGTDQARTAGSAQSESLFSITYAVAGGTADLPGEIAFWLEDCLLPGTTTVSGQNVICAYPDIVDPVWFTIVLKSAATATVQPIAFRLGQNYPNPFNSYTQFSYTVVAADRIQIRVYNILGQIVATLANGDYTPGTYMIGWNGHDDQQRQQAAGIYIYELRSPDYCTRKKMLYLR
ncbi:MAG: T9SS type A sorting domain-containing protein [Candidatus Neomarinimicrobiota bacterium]